MAYEFRLPSLGDDVTGKVLDILVKPGDKVTKEQIVLIVGTDKVDAEIPVDADGIVEEILVKKGDDVTDGTVILKMKSDSASPSSSAPKEKESSSPTATSTSAPAATPPTPPPAPPPAPAPTSSTSDAKQGASGSLRASPLARKRAKEFGINLSDVRPPQGASRISYKDVMDFVKRKIDTSGGSTGTGGAGLTRKPLPNFEKFGTIERKPLGRIGELTAENMHYAFNTIPHAWISEKADITRLEQLRQQHKDTVKAAGGNLTTTAILTKAICSVLRKYPQFNASLDDATNEVIYKKYINIGIAVDTPRGLLVPVIRNCDQKSLTEISVELTELSTRTREGKNKLDDLDGGTFSISNIGGIGGTNMLSIVNWPQVAILSVTAASMEAHWNGKEFEPRLMMPITIGWDHRVINGADAARFLVDLKKILEEPFLGWL